MRKKFLAAALCIIIATICTKLYLGHDNADAETAAADARVEISAEAPKPRTQTDIGGKWFVPDDDNPAQPQSIVLFYKKPDETFAAKMVAIYHDGKIDDTEAAPKERAKKIDGNPFLCGLDFIWGLALDADSARYAGKVVDPDSGKTYKCEVWFDTQKQTLVVRGELLIFGVNQYWPPAPPEQK